jgi:predicted ferric reductase
MMAVQIFLGSDMARMVKKIGNWVVRFHFNHGIVIYSLIIAHTLSFLIFKYIASSKLDPFYVYTDFCLLCQVKTELFYTFGRLSFWVLSFSVSAAYFKNTDTFKKNWKFFHIANYLVFVLAAVHAFFIGHDILSIPYLFVYILSCLFVLYVFGSRLIRAYREIR